MQYNLDFIDPPFVEEIKCKIDKSHFKKDKLVCHHLPNSIILPYQKTLGDNGFGGVLDEKGTLIDFTGLHTGKTTKYQFQESDVKDNNEIAIFVGFFYKVWGHCVTDNLKHLWFLFTEKYKELQLKYPNLKLVFIGDVGTIAMPSFKEMLSISGIDYTRFEFVSVISRFKELYVPDPCFQTNEVGERFFTEEYDNLLSRVDVKPVKRYDKVYFTRSSLKESSRETGEKDIERVFERIGFKIISPERYSFYHQLQILKGCKVFATTEGSIAHNAVFLNKSTNLILLRKASYLNEYQLPINEMRNLNVTYIDVHLSVFVDYEHPSVGPFFLYANDNLSLFSGLNVNSFSYRKFKKYAIQCLLLPHYERRVNADKYLYQKLSYEIEKVKENWKEKFNSLPMLDISQKEQIINVLKKILR